MKKDVLVQQVKDICGLEFSDRSVALHLSNVFSQVVGQLFNADNNQYNYYTKRVTLPVTNRVAEITIPIIQTRSNAKGIVRILPVSSDAACDPDDTEFYPSPSYSLNSSSDANHINGFVFYVVTGTTVRFNRSLPKDVTQVLADVVVSFDAYEDEEEISLPAGVAQTIIDGAVAAIKGDPSSSNIYKKA